jgi:putative ABC transport system permease protein
VLAAGAAVLIRSVEKLQNVDPGLDPRGVAVVEVTSSADVPQQERLVQITQMVESLRALPGVRAVAATQRMPLSGGGDNWGISIQEQPDREPSTTAYRIITHDFFDVMGIKLKSGRLFDASDRTGSELVAVIDEALAEKYFKGQDPVGKMIEAGTGQGWTRIIGVVETVAHGGLVDERIAGRYMLFDQLAYTPEGVSLVLATVNRRDAGSIAQQAVRSIESTMGSVAVQDATTMENVVAVAMGPTRRIMQLMSLLGALALTLGAIGVYGVVSHFVNRRRRDWVIKMALGMKPSDVLQQVVGRGALLVATGCAIGLIASFALTRVLKSLLYEVTAADPIALAGAAAALVLTGCVAAALPGRRASRANPAAVLRDV